MMNSFEGSYADDHGKNNYSLRRASKVLPRLPNMTVKPQQENLKLKVKGHMMEFEPM
jgi:hypothetical protein